MRWLVPCLALAALVACQEREPVATRAPEPAAPAAEAPAGPDRAALAATLRAWLTRHDEAPKKLAEQRCSDDALREVAPSDDDRELALRVEDARFEKKTLLPLRVTNELLSVDAAALETAILPDSTLEPAPIDATLVRQVAWLGQRRFVGVFHVTDYAPPHWIHRIDRLKAEWVPGYLVAWLVVHDAKTGAPQCSTLLHVKNDVTGASLAARDRSDTGERLTRALGRALREEAPGALARMSGALHLGTGPGPHVMAAR